MTTTTSLMLMDRLATMGGPAASIFNTKWGGSLADEDRCGPAGVPHGCVHKPGDVLLRDAVEKEEDENDERVDVAFAKANQKVKKKLGERGSFRGGLLWDRTGRVVQGVVDCQQRGLPGSIASARELLEGPKQITTFQIIVAGVYQRIACAMWTFYAIGLDCMNPCMPYAVCTLLSFFLSMILVSCII